MLRFELLRIAEAEGWIPPLFGAALRAVPGNASLRAIAGKRRG